jgi:orotate phosphoribosyltransferase
VVAAAAGDHLAGSLKRGDLVLSSGRTNTFLFQLRLTTMLKERAALIAEILVEYMQRRAIARIGASNLAPSRSSRRWPQGAI